MSATLIAVVFALILGHAAAPLVQLRRYGWFTGWLKWLREHIHGSWYASAFALLISLGLPLALCALIQHGLSGVFFGLPGFVFGLAMLFYCWGPRDLDLDVEAVLEAADHESQQAALRTLTGEGTALPDDVPGAVTGVFRAAKRRWFGVLFWFLLLGPFGALLYRLAQRGTEATAREHLPMIQANAFARLLAILEWPVAQAMTLALALAGNFDAVYGAWRDWHSVRRDQDVDFDAGFLDAAAQASVRREHAQREAEFDAESTEADIDAPPVETALPSRAALGEAMGLAWRILIVWLAALALFVLAGYV